MRVRRFLWVVSCVVIAAASMTEVVGRSAAEPESQLAPTQVILLRHAEKAAEPKGDPVLSAAGEARVKRLSELFAEMLLTHVYASEFQRTQRTVQPFAAARGLKVTVVPAKDSTGLAAQLRALDGGVALVAGHSNTLGPILEALGADPIAEIPETDYDNLFVVTLHPSHKPTVLRLRVRGEGGG
jgi:phosphohistidine phosphatase SixA